MLILRRKFGETIFIDHEITVTVFGTDKGRVKLGISAPKEVIVNREEVHNRLQRKIAHAEKTKLSENDNVVCE